jgi:hypothetical protein
VSPKDSQYDRLPERQQNPFSVPVSAQAAFQARLQPWAPGSWKTCITIEREIEHPGEHGPDGPSDCQANLPARPRVVQLTLRSVARI